MNEWCKLFELHLSKGNWDRFCEGMHTHTPSYCDILQKDNADEVSQHSERWLVFIRTDVWVGRIPDERPLLLQAFLFWGETIYIGFSQPQQTPPKPCVKWSHDDIFPLFFLPANNRSFKALEKIVVIMLKTRRFDRVLESYRQLLAMMNEVFHCCIESLDNSDLCGCMHSRLFLFIPASFIQGIRNWQRSR